MDASRMGVSTLLLGNTVPELPLTTHKTSVLQEKQMNDVRCQNYGDNSILVSQVIHLQYRRKCI